MTDDRTCEPYQKIIQAGQFLYEAGWVPATSGNFSVRLDSDRVAVTVSGKHKGRLSEADILMVDMLGKPLEKGKTPSAETLLHTTLYRMAAKTGAVLHTHSIGATVLSRLTQPGTDLWLEGYEVLKAFRGITTHESRVRIPVFANSQDMTLLSTDLAFQIKKGSDIPGFLIRGHGLYTWGEDMEEALRHIEAFEFLFACELEIRRMVK